MTPDNYALTELIPLFPSVMTCAEEDLENSSRMPLLDLHWEVGNPCAENMITKLELFQHKPEINIQERCADLFTEK
jgi:hypothetical protein